MWYKPQRDKTSSYRMNDLEVLSERLRSLKIINKASEETNKWSDKEMSVAPALTNENVQVTVSKNIIPDLG